MRSALSTLDLDTGTTPIVKHMLTAVQDGPVLVGPLEMGLLLYHPGAGNPIEADHYLVVQSMDSGRR